LSTKNPEYLGTKNTRGEGKMAVKKKAVTAELKQMEIQIVQIKINGTSPLIMHRWDEKAKKEMLNKQMKLTQSKSPKDPEAQYEASVYKLDDGRLAFPADAFKQSAIRGGKYLGLVMTDLRAAFFVEGEYSEKEDRLLVPIGGELSMREDMVKLSGPGNVADIRYRGQVKGWSATLMVSYNPNLVSFDQLCNMFNQAGYGVGLGEWRPERDGTFGRFEVVA
jgi:hypothetical protein